MYNFQGPMPPYQGYPFSGMQPIPPYYPANMPWPANVDESGHPFVREHDHRQNQKSSSGNKHKASNGKGHGSPGEDRTESADSDSKSDSDADIQQDGKHSSADSSYKKKHKRKSSRTVVIRNINYITSKRRDGEVSGESSDEDEVIDGEILKQKVDEAVGSLEKLHKPQSRHHKKKGGEKNHLSADKDLNNELVEDASEMEKKNNWDAFQSLLTVNDDSTTNRVRNQHSANAHDEQFMVKTSEDTVSFAVKHAVELEFEKVKVQQRVASDYFVVSEREGENEGSSDNLKDFQNDENFHPSMKRRDCENEEFLFPQRLKESGTNIPSSLSDCTSESSTIKKGNSEDWFVAKHSGESKNYSATSELRIFDGDYSSSIVDVSSSEKCKKDAVIDDSFMVQARSSSDDQYYSQWRTDLSMDSDIIVAAQTENISPDTSMNKIGVSGSCEPNDLCMVLERDSELGFGGASYAPEVDYGIDISFSETDKRCPTIETNYHEDEKPPLSSNGKNTADFEAKNPGKEARSKVRGSPGKSKPELTYKSKKPSTISRPMVQKSKLEKVLITCFLVPLSCFISLYWFLLLSLLIDHFLLIGRRESEENGRIVGSAAKENC